MGASLVPVISACYMTFVERDVIAAHVVHPKGSRLLGFLMIVILNIEKSWKQNKCRGGKNAGNGQLSIPVWILYILLLHGASGGPRQCLCVPSAHTEGS